MIDIPLHMQPSQGPSAAAAAAAFLSGGAVPIGGHSARLADPHARRLGWRAPVARDSAVAHFSISGCFVLTCSVCEWLVYELSDCL